MSQLGLGFSFTAKDKSAAVFKSIGAALTGLQSQAKKTQTELSRVGPMGGGVAGAMGGGRQRDASSGRFVGGAAADGGLGGLAAGGGGAGFGLGGMMKLAAGAGGALAFKQMADQGAVLQQGLARLGVISGATTEDLKRMRQAAIDIGLSTKFSPDQAVDALTSLSSAGLTAQQSLDLLGTTMQFTAAAQGKLSSDQSANLLAQSMALFNMASKDGQMAGDKMAKTANMFAVNIEDLPLGLANSARGVTALGASMDDTLISFGLVRKLLPRVESAGTAVGVAMESLAKPEVQQALKGIGVSAVTSAGKFRPFLDVVSDMLPKMNAMTDAQRAAFLQSTFGADAVQGLGAMFTQLRDGIPGANGQLLKGAEAVKFLRGEMGNANGELQKFSDATKTGFGGAMDSAIAKLTTAKQLFGEALGDVIAPAISSLGDGVAKLVRSFEQLDSSAKRNIVALVVIGTVVGGLVAMFGAVGVAVAAGLGLAMGVVYAFKEAIERNIGGMGDRFNQVKLAWRALVEVFTTGSLSSAVNAELNKAEGVNAFVTAVVTFVGRIKALFAGIGDGFSSGLGRAGPTFERLANAFSSLASAGGLLGQSAGGATSAWQKFGAVGQSIGGALAKGFDLAGRAVSAVLEVGAGFMGQMGGIKAAVEPLGVIFTTIKQKVHDLASAMGLMSPTGATSGWQKFGEIIGKVASFVAAVITGIARVIFGIAEAIGGFVQFVAGIFAGDWSEVWLGAKRVVFGLLTAVVEIAMGIVMTLASMLDAAGRIAKVNIGATDKVRGWRDEARKALDVTNLEETRDNTNQVDDFRSNAQFKGLEKMVKSQGSIAIPTTMDGNSAPGWLGGLTAALKENAKATLPPQVINFQIDGETVASLVTGADGRGTQPRLGAG